MGNPLLGALISAAVFAYGVVGTLFCWISLVRAGVYFKRPTEEEKTELLLAQDRLWNLSKQWEGFSHRFLTLRDGFKFHYVTNDVPDQQKTASKPAKPLVVFIHGFPDSWALWRHILMSTALRESSSLVAVDLPGFGGSDRLQKYTATNVLEKLTEFVVMLREDYEIDDDTDGKTRGRVIIVAHDWGCVLAMRLAAEAPQLADRFILTNGPLMGLVSSNATRLITMASKMLKIFVHSPIRSRSMLTKALKMLKPVFRQMLASYYVFSVLLPLPVVRFLGSSGNRALMRSIHIVAHGTKGEYTVRDAAESMANCMGPSAEECNTETADQQKYPDSVIQERDFPANFVHMTGYYRDGAGIAQWSKSVETIAALHGLSGDSDLRRRSSRAGVFDEGPTGSLKASATIVWGLRDFALDRNLSLDGIGDYLVYNSQVITLPRAGHFTPIEQESRIAIAKVVEWAVAGEKGDVVSAVEPSYAGAALTLST